MNHTSLKYVPHIDGLRALAVMAVFAYHLAPDVVRSGFMGVDVFFVISGYLITRIIKEKTESKSFSLSGFYIRRVRRLLPAYVAIVVVAFLVGLLLLSPPKLVELANTGIWSLVGLSNFYINNHMGYFDARVDSLMFLHTWSLAVEEQFYLVWPSLLLVILGLGKPEQRKSLLALLLLGIAFSAWLTHYDRNAAFFMMPARTGEFAFGAILNFFPLGRLKRAQSRLVADGSFLALVGLLIFLPKPEEFPGLIVFLACACTSALILYGNNGTVSGPALTNRVSVKIGLISYSLYLIHWPLIQYAQELGYPMQGITPALLVMLGLALAALSEKWIERPFRTTNGPWKSRLSVAASGGLAVIFVCFVLAHTIMRKGFPERIPESVRHVAESIESERDRRYATLRSMCGERSWESCKARSDTERNVLIIGDSQAVDGLNILNAFAPENHYILDSVAGCPPMTFPSFAREIDRTLETYDECEEQVRRYDTAEMYRNIDTVIISASYEQPSDLGDFLTQLRVHFDGNVLVFGRSTQFSRELPDFVMSARPFPRLEKRAFLELSQHEPFDLELLEIASKHDAKFESKISWFCSDTEQECDVFVDQSSLLISYDRSHLSKRAAEWIGSQFRKKYGNWEGLFPSSPGRGRSMPQRRTGPR